MSYHSSESEKNNLVKIISLQDVKRSIQTLEDFAKPGIKNLTKKCEKDHDKFMKSVNELKE